MTGYPPLPRDVVVLPGTDLEGEWERFRIFEALHHGMRICNPMTDTDLDALIARLDPADGTRVLDLACGHGELLMRIAAGYRIEGVGVDLSPWVIARAATTAARRGLVGSVTWYVGEARTAGIGAPWQIVTCLGAPWVWHGFGGTARALAERAAPGGRIAIGDLRLRDGADVGAIADEHGRVATRHDQAAMLAEAGLRDVHELELAPGGWDAYMDRVAASAQKWAELNAGEEAERYLAESEMWRNDHERDRGFLTWTVWTARRP